MAETVPHFTEITGVPPYPWQQRCYAQLLTGTPPRELSLPTGTGKTSVVLLYLLALAEGAPLPRRLAYVVDRRAIVDQTTAELRGWIEAMEGIPRIRVALESKAAFDRADSCIVELGTLRGGLADTGTWRLDPARPAVLVGTVDIIGSRLLFSGYGDGRSRRSLHAGLLGTDTTVVLDESHLSPAFAHTLHEVEALHTETLGRQFHALTMSATPREAGETTLDAADKGNEVLGRRLGATKRPSFWPVESTPAWRQTMVELALEHESGTVLVFARSAQEAQRLYADLVRALGDQGEQRVGLLTGTLRGAEREQLTAQAIWRAFASRDERPREPEPLYLVATAAGEVGVDLDADHMVMDLVPMDSMIQRLGRVNRAGLASDSTVAIVYTTQAITFETDKDEWKHRYAAACAQTLEHLQRLPNLAPTDLLGLSTEELQECATPTPQAVPLEASRLSLLAATSAGIDLPPVAPYLRGITEEPDPAEVHLLWRKDTEWLLEQGVGLSQEAIEMMPPRPRELLKAPAYAADRDLVAMARRHGPFRCLWLGPDGSASELEIHEDSRGLQRLLRYATLVLPAKVGGLSTAGFLDPKATGTDGLDLADDEDGIRFERRGEATPADLPDWVQRAVQWEIPLHDLDDDEVEPRWWVFARRRPGDLSLDADSELPRLARASARLSDHNHEVKEAARQIGMALGLPEWVVNALAEAGARHDAGKQARVWQLAAGNRSQEPIAKSRTGRFRPALLGGYRHEFGSLVAAVTDLPVKPESSEQPYRDLVLHLIAAHHGHGRPGFPKRQQWNPEVPDAHNESVAKEAEERYVRLQQTFGPWGLAWLEGLLKSADAWVSSGNRAQSPESHHG